MKSAIHVSDCVPNAARKFGSAKAYYPVRVHLEFASHKALFTEDQIIEAIERAKLNPEDFPAAKPRRWWQRWFW